MYSRYTVNQSIAIIAESVLQSPSRLPLSPLFSASGVFFWKQLQMSLENSFSEISKLNKFLNKSEPA